MPPIIDISYITHFIGNPTVSFQWAHPIAVEAFFLAKFYSGPFIVTDLLPYNKVQMKNLQTDTLYPHPIHFSRLRLATHYKPELAYRDA